MPYRLRRDPEKTRPVLPPDNLLVNHQWLQLVINYRKELFQGLALQPPKLVGPVSPEVTNLILLLKIY